MEECLTTGVDIDSKDVIGRTLLMIGRFYFVQKQIFHNFVACEEGHLNLIDFLLKKGANFKYTNDLQQNALYFLLLRQRWALLAELKKQVPNIRIGLQIVHSISDSYTGHGTAADALLSDKCKAGDMQFLRRLHESGIPYDLGLVSKNTNSINH